MSEALTLLDRYYRARSGYWRRKRLVCPSPAEVRFMRLMGATVWTIGRPTETRPAVSIVLWRGKLLRRAGMHREFRIGKHYADFGNSIYWLIEIDGSAWHRDPVVDMEREIYMREHIRRISNNRQDMRLLRIKAARLWNNPADVRAQVIEFLQA